MEFLNELVKEFKRTYYIKYIKTTAYHPQRNSQMEWANQMIKNILVKKAKTYDMWNHYMDSALFTARTIRQNSTSFSPFELAYGRNLRWEFNIIQLKFELYEDRIWSYITWDIYQLQLVQWKVAAFIDKAQER